MILILVMKNNFYLFITNLQLLNHHLLVDKQNLDYESCSLYE